MSVTNVLLGISLIIFFGACADFFFKKTKVPDALFLILLGYILGPNALGYVLPEQFASAAPAFTTFTLLFLLFDGAFNIDLVSFAKGIYQSLSVTLFNFVMSAAVITGVMYLFNYSFIISLLTGFILGGISSSYVIPVLKRLSTKKEVYSLLTLESAFTDVLCIVSALTVIDILTINQFQVQAAVSQVVSLFAVAAFIGILSGALWLLAEVKLFQNYKSYILTIAAVIFVFVLTDFLGGNGAIATLFFGLMLRNSKQLISISKGLVSKSKTEQRKALSGELGISVLTPSETFFYDQISFFLKTFFFVYIGVLIDISNTWLLVIGGAISVAAFFSRDLSRLVTQGYTKLDRSIISSFSARGLAAAALAAIVIQRGIEGATELSIIVYTVIIGTTLFSSLRVFLVASRKSAAADPTVPVSKPNGKLKRVKKK